MLPRYPDLGDKEGTLDALDGPRGPNLRRQESVVSGVIVQVLISKFGAPGILPSILPVPKVYEAPLR